MKYIQWIFAIVISFSLFACAGNAKTKVEHGEYYESTMQFDIALDKYNRAIAIEPNNPDLYFRKGRVRAKMAVPLLLEISKERSVNADGQNVRNGKDINVNVDLDKIALIDMKIRKCHEDAIVAFKKALELDQNMQVVFFPLASSYFQLQDWDNAIIYFNRALEANYENPDAYYFLAECYDKLGQHDVAKENYQLAAQYGSQKAKEKLH